MKTWEILTCAGIVPSAFLLWEVVAWFTHKYVMHGFLWEWHKTHHRPHDKFFEKNDLFVVLFSLPSVFHFYYFTQAHYNPYMVSVAVGIFCYGAFYLVFHDIIVHQRVKWRPAKGSRYFATDDSRSLRSPQQDTKQGCEAFGFLYAPKKYEPKKFTFRQKRQDTQ